MPRSARPRKAYRPRAVASNAVQVAVNNVHQLDRNDVRGQAELLRTALAEFQRGRDAGLHWRSLADAANMAETLAAMSIGSGPDADRIIERAQQVLHDVALRHRERGTWALKRDELDALQWLLSLHTTQLAECDYSEFARAMDRTHNRIAQARSGNAPAGAVVVRGEIG